MEKIKYTEVERENKNDHVYICSLGHEFIVTTYDVDGLTSPYIRCALAGCEAEAEHDS